MCIFGMFVMSAAIGAVRLAMFGVDPFQSLMGGLDSAVPLSFGTTYAIANIILLVVVFFIDRKSIGLSTVLNFVMVGYIVELSHNTLLGMFPDITMEGRILSFIIGMVVGSFGISFYFVVDMGVSPYDAIALSMANKWKLMKFRYCRITTDVVCVLIGATLMITVGDGMEGMSAIIGIGTIMAAFCMGPLIDFFVEKCAKPVLEQQNKEGKSRALKSRSLDSERL